MTDTSLDPAPGRRPSGPNAPAEIRVGVMTDELARGRARYLSATIKDFVQYRSGWWILDRDIWFAVDDDELIASLNAAVEAMAVADAAVSRSLGRRD